MFRTRAVSTLLLGPLFMGVVILASPFVEVLLLVVMAAIAREFDRICNGTTTAFGMTVLVTSVVLGLLLVVPGGRPDLIPWLSGSLILMFGFGKHVLLPEQPPTMSYALPYVVLPGLGLLFVVQAGGSVTLIWLIAIIWATDIGAYLFGRLIGGPKMAPAISPNKTWAGLLGGMISAGCVAWLTAEYSAMNRAVVLVPIAMCLAVVSQAGDLFESAIKRLHGRKDSGGLIPGHGGVMDRFDGLWGAAPAIGVICAVSGGGIYGW